MGGGLGSVREEVVGASRASSEEAMQDRLPPLSCKASLLRHSSQQLTSWRGPYRVACTPCAPIDQLREAKGPLPVWVLRQSHGGHSHCLKPGRGSPRVLLVPQKDNIFHSRRHSRSSGPPQTLTSHPGEGTEAGI